MKNVLRITACVGFLSLITLMPYDQPVAKENLASCSDPWWTTIHYPGGGGICDTNGSACCGAGAPQKQSQSYLKLDREKETISPKKPVLKKDTKKQ